MEIRIYIEGGGDSNHTKRFLRHGFSAFFSKLLPRNPKVIMCGSRRSAYENFRTALQQHKDAFNILLVDSEGPVTTDAWQHLQKQDQWANPDASGDQCHLMAQVMETWFIADPGALSTYYGQGFKRNAMPPRRDVEQIEKRQIEESLIKATVNTSKGKYHKTQHAPKLLETIDPTVVRTKAPHCNRLFETLERTISG